MSVQAAGISRTMPIPVSPIGLDALATTNGRYCHPSDGPACKAQVLRPLSLPTITSSSRCGTTALNLSRSQPADLTLARSLPKFSIPPVLTPPLPVAAPF